jgi:hypothetical protein
MLHDLPLSLTMAYTGPSYRSLGTLALILAIIALGARPLPNADDDREILPHAVRGFLIADK